MQERHMGETANKGTADALHGELCSAIADLAKSVDVAVTRIALRAKCTAAIADAVKVEQAAEALIAVAREAEAAEHDITLVPAVHTLEKPRRESERPVEQAVPCTAADELYDACSWLATQQGPRPAVEGQDSRQESIIAMRILELQERLGGLIKK